MNWKHFVTGACCTALFAVPALLLGSTLSKADMHFMKMAADANMTEAHIGQMAEAQGAQQGVKDFGKRLSSDHTAAYEQLTALAKKTGDMIPTAIGKDKTITHLSHLKGASFDRAFAQEEVQSHKTAIAAFRNEADHGTNPEVKEWAKNTIPTLEAHLKMAEDLVKQGK